MVHLTKGTKFIKGQNFKKYTALVPINGSIKKVSFGDTRYEHYKDSVPKELGGGLWSHKDHNDKERRKNYRLRHGAQGYQHRKNSPAWFSYYFLW